MYHGKRDERTSTIRPICRRLSLSVKSTVQQSDSTIDAAATVVPTTTASFTAVPSLYVLNAAALSKPEAVEHLAADLKSYSVSVAVITETHFKKKHADGIIGVEGYTVFRRDRIGRKGGGVALYVQSAIQSSRWTPSVADNRAFEIQWVRVGVGVFVAAIYQPPRPTYKLEELLDYIETSVEEINHDFPQADIVLAGDLNQLSDKDLSQIVYQPTRGGNILDRVFVSNPQLYSTIRVVASIVKSDHMAVVAFPQSNQPNRPKSTTQCSFRSISPGQHAQFLQSAAGLDLNNPYPTASSDPSTNA